MNTTAIKFRLTTKEARAHVARRMADCWADRSYSRIALGAWHVATGDQAESIADAINGGPLGGSFEFIGSES